MSGSELIHTKNDVESRVVDNNQICLKLSAANHKLALLANKGTYNAASSGSDAPLLVHGAARNVMSSNELERNEGMGGTGIKQNM